MKRLPTTGVDWPTLERELASRKNADSDWRNGRVPYLVYFVDDALKLPRMFRQGVPTPSCVCRT